jgi:hypothetical protein
MNSICNREFPTIPDNLPWMLDEKNAALVLGVSVAFLRKSRSEGTHHDRTPAPPFIYVGGRVYYPTEDLRAWLAARERRLHI